MDALAQLGEDAKRRSCAWFEAGTAPSSSLPVLVPYLYLCKITDTGDDEVNQNSNPMPFIYENPAVLYLLLD